MASAKFIGVVCLLACFASISQAQSLVGCTLTATKCGESRPRTITTTCRSDCKTDGTYWLLDSQGAFFFVESPSMCPEPYDGTTVVRVPAGTVAPCNCVTRVSGVGSVCDAQLSDACVLRLAPSNPATGPATSLLIDAERNLVVSSSSVSAGAAGARLLGLSPSFSSTSELSLKLAYSVSTSNAGTYVSVGAATALSSVAGNSTLRDEAAGAKATAGFLRAADGMSYVASSGSQLAPAKQVSTAGKTDGTISVAVRKGQVVATATASNGASSSATGTAQDNQRVFLQLAATGSSDTRDVSVKLTSLSLTHVSFAALFGKSLKFTSSQGGVCAYIAGATEDKAYRLTFKFGFPLEYVKKLGGDELVSKRLIGDLSNATGVPADRFSFTAFYGNTLADITVRPANAMDVANRAAFADLNPKAIVDLVASLVSSGAPAIKNGVMTSMALSVTSLTLLTCPDGTFRDSCADPTVSSKGAVAAIIVLVVVVVGSVIGYWIGMKYMRMRKAAIQSEIFAQVHYDLQHQDAEMAPAPVQV